MKQRILTIVVALMALFSVNNAYGWRSNGHGTIGYIADRNLTPKARKMCAKYLGHSLSYHASWFDNWRYSKEYHHTARWHAVGVKSDGSFVPGQLLGDISDFLTKMYPEDHMIARLAELRTNLKDYKNMSDSAVAVNLCAIIHIVGDMHCPGHTFFEGETQFVMKEGDSELRYHGFWDDSYTRFHGDKTSDQFYKEFCTLTPEEIADICKGEPEEWLRANFPQFRETYTLVSPGMDVRELSEENKKRAKEMTDILHRNAGYRLAYVINQIFK